MERSDAVYIRGNHGMLGNWEYGKVHLARKADSLWAGIFLMPRDTKLKFLFDGGSASKGFQKMDTIHHMVTSDTAITIHIKGPLISSVAEYPSGAIHKIPRTTPGNIQSRMVTVRTPVGYESDTARRYPVLYLMDGQCLLDAEDCPDGLTWDIDHTLDSLEFHKVISPVILVAIDHVFKARSFEYADSEYGARYRSYLQNDLIDAIDRQFRTIASPSARTIGGSVAGGFVAFLTAWESPDRIGNVLALSPAVEVYENNIFPLLESYEGPAKQLNVYMDAGEFELDEKIKPGVEKLHNWLKEHGNRSRYTYVPNSIPDSENMGFRVIPALQYFYGIVQ